MRELTIEEKAKRYDEAIKDSKQILSTPYTAHWDTMKDVIEHLFPELREDNDEKIRKALVKIISDIDGGFPFEKHGILKKEAREWLEKQGQVKDSTISQHENKTCKENGDSLTSEDEKQSEQKPTDKVEPKFKVGVWVVNNVSEHVFRIKSITGRHCTLEDTRGNIMSPCLLPCENYCHLWTIQDAKDGDVLVASDDSIFLYKCTIDCACKYYIALTTDGAIKFNKGLEHYWETSRAVHPATKGQRILLFEKMKEAGYVWDEEKKALKKIEQKPAMIQWKGHNLKEVIDFTGKSPKFKEWFKTWEEYESYVHSHGDVFKIFNEDGSHYEIPVGAWIVKTPDGYNVASQATYKQKPNWSEEDENMLNRVIMDVKTLREHVYCKSLCDEEYVWLKALKDRVC